ncbi:YeiH family protein [Vogesella urethralis]|uniref:YeiH family protein n=1 Tax=Vogesella urethralis TaxID=2592656 RepID=UPI001184AD40|nr:putative sulfate exporter family transporter [Vogesella urethralis]
MKILDKQHGLLLALALALASLWLATLTWLAAHGVSALTVAMLLGMLAANLGPRHTRPDPHTLAFCKTTVLRTGIVLFGLRLTLGELGQLGPTVWLIDAAVLGSTFALALWAGPRLGLDRESSVLIGAGSAICGAAAVMAAQPVIRASGERASLAVAGVVLFGSLAMLLYPAAYPLLASLGVSDTAYGVMTGSTLHEVAQVVAAGKAVSDQAANAAVLTKMLRVMMLAPFLLLLAAWWQRRQPQADGQRGRITIPWFAFGFVAMVALNSSGWLPAAVVAPLQQLTTLLLATAMAALGLDTRASAIRAAGWQPLLLAGLLFGWLMAGGGLFNWLLG